MIAWSFIINSLSMQFYHITGKRKKKAFLDLLLDENEKADTPLTDDELRAQVDTFMFECKSMK